MLGKCLLKLTVEGKVKGGTKVTRRQGRKCKQLLDDLKVTKGYSKLKGKLLDCTLWRTRFGRGGGMN